MPRDVRRMKDSPARGLKPDGASRWRIASRGGTCTRCACANRMLHFIEWKFKIPPHSPVWSANVPKSGIFGRFTASGMGKYGAVEHKSNDRQKQGARSEKQRDRARKSSRSTFGKKAGGAPGIPRPASEARKTQTQRRRGESAQHAARLRQPLRPAAMRRRA